MIEEEDELERAERLRGVVVGTCRICGDGCCNCPVCVAGKGKDICNECGAVLGAEASK
jgi:hypothetical protein